MNKGTLSIFWVQRLYRVGEGRDFCFVFLTGKNCIFRTLQFLVCYMYERIRKDEIEEGNNFGAFHIIVELKISVSPCKAY